MPPPYQRNGLTLARGAADRDLVRALQRDLRALGYLYKGIDGDFGAATEKAIRALQYDLLHNSGASTGNDGNAPVAITDYNNREPRVTALSGVLDQSLAGCIARMIDDPRILKVPRSADPARDNAAALAMIAALPPSVVPIPFLYAIIRQEAGGRHFYVPTGSDGDDFLVVGLDRNNEDTSDQITSRGYGIGQYTVFHHPLRAEEMAGFVGDPRRNVQKAVEELRRKFDGFVNGPADTADDRVAEIGHIALRPCRYVAGDPRRLRDCKNCASGAPKKTIIAGTRFHPNTRDGYETDRYYSSASYDGVPDRAALGCDWPYAARRYNGSGNSSYHYQTRILLKLLDGPEPALPAIA